MEKMYLNFIKSFVGLACFYLFIISCDKKEQDNPSVTGQDTQLVMPTPFTVKPPYGFPAAYTSSANPLTVEGIELGRSLYSDPILSSNGLSCSSCHQKDRSFSSPLFMLPNGIKISVPPHLNLAFKRYYNWEGSFNNLDTLCMGDFGPLFFNTDSAQLYQRLLAHPTYPGMFKKAFLIKKMDTLSLYNLKTYICHAISQYMRTMVSANSKYDRSQYGAAHLTEDENEGMKIFFSERGDCFHCHVPPLFTDDLFHNNGVDNVYNGFDQGRFLVTMKDKDLGKFHTPTLRNIAQTAPYMHDGRFAMLEDVVEFYCSGVKISPYSDPIMNKNGNNHILNLTPLEKQQLIAFLKTLTDEDYVK